ncbi:MAG: hypothetical protein NUV65_06965 [Candidatus Roizmanbacteria bacterium]|nr:hypothetical protein [Candidatus Roizmanbacteria bacterium]
MNIVEKLINYYRLAENSGYIPSTIGVSDEEYQAYAQSLKDMAETVGLVFIDKPTKLTFRGIELKKYGKQHTDAKRKKTP